MSRILLPLLIAMSFSAHAEFRATLLSWQQLTSLTPAQRREYLADYRRLLVMMDKQQLDHNLVAAAPDASFSEQAAFVVQYFAFPQAEAEGSGAPSVNAPPKILPEWNQDSGGWDCSGNNSGRRTYRFDPQIGTCVLLYTDTAFNKFTRFTGQGNIQAYPNWTSRTCPGESDGFEGTVSVPSPVGKGYDACVPRSSFNALSSSRQSALAAGEFLKADSFKTATKESTESAVLGGKLQEDAKAAAAAAVAGSAKQPKNASESGAVTPVPGAGDAPPATGAKPETPVVPALGEDVCSQPKERKCRDGEESEAVKKWRTNASGKEENVCIIGGFFSHYENPNPIKAKGKCLPVRQFPLPPAAAIGKTCPVGQALCNPFVFCVSQKNPAGKKAYALHCESITKPNTNVTERCAKWLNEVVPPGAKQDASPNVCDHTEANFKPTTAWGKAWEDQRKEFEANFNRRCFSGEDGKGFEELFCKECNAMSQILFRMNNKTVKSGCASKPATAPPPATPKRGTNQPAAAPPGAGEIPPVGDDPGAKR